MDVMERVLIAFRGGATTRKDIAAVTGLDAQVVDVTVDVLLRTGKMDEYEIKSACTAGGCGNCVEDSHCAPASNLIQIGRN